MPWLPSRLQVSISKMRIPQRRLTLSVWPHGSVALSLGTLPQALVPATHTVTQGACGRQQPYREGQREEDTGAPKPEGNCNGGATPPAQRQQPGRVPGGQAGLRPAQGGRAVQAQLLVPLGVQHWQRNNGAKCLKGSHGAARIRGAAASKVRAPLLAEALLPAIQGAIPTHPEPAGHPGLCGNSRTCNYKTCAVALGVLVLVLLIAVVVLEVSLSGRFPAVQGPCCPDGWVGYQGKCWTYSRSRCSALGASLAGIDTLKEKDFLLRHEGERSYWIGLRRDLGQSWKWANGTEFNNQFEIRGDGDCVYVNKNGISSWRCTSEGHWICSKPDELTAAKETPEGGGL